MYPSRWTQFFGPSTWKALHSITFTFPSAPTEAQKKDYKDFVESLAKVLPCPHCSVHMKEYIRDHPIDVSNRQAFSRWGVEFHNSVNRRLGKPELSFDEVAKRYSGWTESDSRKLQSRSEKEIGELLGSPYYSEKSLGEFPPTVVVVSAILLLLAIAAFYLLYWRKRAPAS